MRGDGPGEHQALALSLQVLGSQQPDSSSQSSPGSSSPFPQVARCTV